MSEPVASVCESQPVFAQLTHFGGFDWASVKHQLVAVDPAGQIVLSLEFADDAGGWATLRGAA